MKITAPAKLNLYLHITGRREDGYHLLDSLFVFTDWGDEITVSESDHIELHITGNKVDSSIEDNLVFRAAKLLQEKYKVKKGARIALTKNIPVAAGLGGGSSDAAATLIALNQFWKLLISHETLSEIGLSLGADVPACIYQKPVWVRGIGEKITPVTLSHSPFVLLINPNQPLSTQAVFQQYQNSATAFSPSTDSHDFSDFYNTLSKNKNDLEKSAIALLPEIQLVLNALENTAGCRLSRMSGSGPTCFALFDQKKCAIEAKMEMEKQFAGYWMTVSAITPRLINTI